MCVLGLLSCYIEINLLRLNLTTIAALSSRACARLRARARVCLPAIAIALVNTSALLCSRMAPREAAAYLRGTSM